MTILKSAKFKAPGLGASPAIVWALVAALLLLFQNCGSFEAATNLKSSIQYDSTGGSGLQPVTDRADTQCLQKSDYHACLFYKNPVAQNGQTQPGNLIAAPLDSLQSYGVRLTGLANTGLLENTTIRIETVTGTPVSTRSTMRFRAQNDVSRSFTQVSAYYWMNRGLEFIEAQTGRLHSKGQMIRVVVDDTIAGWSSKTNSIHLKLDESGNPMAWSAELAIHFLGLAEAHYASRGAISAPAPTQHRECGLKANGCCTTAAGCARAIASGVGDYYAAMIFPDRPIMGETWMNNPNGMGLCGLTRNLNDAKTRTMQTAFNACSAQNGTGEVTGLGSVYASIWWEVRNAARARMAGDEKSIDQLFSAHLTLLDGNDTFQTAVNKAKTLDGQLFGGKFSQLFDAELAKR